MYCRYTGLGLGGAMVWIGVTSYSILLSIVDMILVSAVVLSLDGLPN